ncbi:PREDICTED: ER membrane protein complex subunit 4-like [Priapulus caudatus]|uniref:ER membrane protein complex subunit 4 n=1 Tax=Priapulus caudatus TaxID=37621 RepID=A0ABM1F278_PRICU|nr:PREDICTED: ER membrane protein complex subunit 4-like [Priapulus caudatus]
MSAPSQTSGSRFKKHKWALDYTLKKADRQLQLQTEHLPVGYCSTALAQVQDAHTGTRDPNLVVKKSWDIALAPMKQLPMNLFIMWMSGNSISIFPIMMVGMMLFRPFKALFTLQNTFKMIEGSQAIIQRMVYFLGNVLGIGLALYKCQSMGLLPTHSSDWLAFVQPQQRLEYSGGGIPLS